MDTVAYYRYNRILYRIQKNHLVHKTMVCMPRMLKDCGSIVIMMPLDEQLGIMDARVRVRVDIDRRVFRL